MDARTSGCGTTVHRPRRPCPVLPGEPDRSGCGASGLLGMHFAARGSRWGLGAPRGKVLQEICRCSPSWAVPERRLRSLCFPYGRSRAAGGSGVGFWVPFTTQRRRLPPAEVGLKAVRK